MTTDKILNNRLEQSTFKKDKFETTDEWLKRINNTYSDYVSIGSAYIRDCDYDADTQKFSFSFSIDPNLSKLYFEPYYNPKRYELNLKPHEAKELYAKSFIDIFIKIDSVNKRNDDSLTIVISDIKIDRFSFFENYQQQAINLKNLKTIPFSHDIMYPKYKRQKILLLEISDQSFTYKQALEYVKVANENNYGGYNDWKFTSSGILWDYYYTPENIEKYDGLTLWYAESYETGAKSCNYYSIENRNLNTLTEYSLRDSLRCHVQLYRVHKNTDDKINNKKQQYTNNTDNNKKQEFSKKVNKSQSFKNKVLIAGGIVLLALLI